MEQKRGSITGSVQHSEQAVGASRDMVFRVTPFLIFFSLWIGFAGWIINFDIGYTGTVFQMQPFNRAFGSCISVHGQEACSLSATAQSVGGSVHIIFMGLGGAISGVTGHYLGRRYALQLASLLVIVGAAGMLGSTGNYVAYVVCKCIGGVGLGQLQMLGPLYAVEVTPANRRGSLVALFVVGQSLGNMVVACVCLGSAKLTTDWAWKTPIACQIPVSVLFGVVLLAFPESPRWYLSRNSSGSGPDDDEAARKSFARFYNKDPNSPEVVAQVEIVKMTVEAERLTASSTHWTEIFHRNNLRRTLTAAYPTCAASLSGALAIFTYAAVFLSGIGIKNPYLTNVIINATLLAGSFLGPIVLENLGRRRSAITGYSSMSICMLIFAVVSSAKGNTSQVAHRVNVAALCIWTFSFGGFIASSQWLTSAEMHSDRLRTHGQAFVIGVNDIVQFASSFWTPYMINPQYGNWGTNVGYFYFGLELAILAVYYLVVPENACLTLEQVDDFFASNEKPWKTSLAKNQMVADHREVDPDRGNASSLKGV